MKNKKTTQKAGTIAWLEEIYLNDGYKAAREEFRNEYSTAVGRPYYPIKADEGEPTRRTDVTEAERISYESFNPPAVWEVPYALLKARFEYAPKKDFIFHSGEELLIPTSGEVFYHFYTHEDPKGASIYTPPALKPGSIARANPQMPHHNWGGKEGGEAWMCILHVSNTPTSINLTLPVSSAKKHTNSRNITKKRLDEAGIYPLVAWGISEHIRLHRERANCRISDLAEACGIDPSHASRIENADTNVSLDTLKKIAETLQINLDELIAPYPWHFYSTAFPKAKSSKRPSYQSLKLQPEDVHHMLHPVYWEIPSGQTFNLDNNNRLLFDIVSSWIILKGRVVFEVENDGEGNPVLLDEGGVLHLKHTTIKSIHALQRSQLLQITYSESNCPCIPQGR